jgi:hypothetical protein
MPKTTRETSKWDWLTIGLIFAVSLWNVFFPFLAEDPQPEEISHWEKIELAGKEFAEDPFIRELDQAYQDLRRADVYAEHWLYRKNLPEIRKLVDKYPDRPNLEEYLKSRKRFY